MATLSEKVKLSLDECRSLVLGTQVLISLQFDLPFQPNFDSVSVLSQRLVLVGLSLLLLSFALLLWGPAYCRISLSGRPVRRANAFMIATMIAALLPLAAAMGMDAFILFDTLCGRVVAFFCGASFFLICMLAWYAMGIVARFRPPPEVIAAMNKSSNENDGSNKLHEQVNQVMTEARVVLPGAQAMLGFECITFFTKSFAQLPPYVKGVHLACAGLIALAVVLLMTPAAFHRLADGGEESKRLVRVAAWCVVGAMIPLAMGMSGDFFVIALKTTGRPSFAIAAGVAMFCIFGTFWFGYTLWRREPK